MAGVSCAQRVLETGFDPGVSALRRPVLSSALEGPKWARAPLPRRLRWGSPTGRNRGVLRGCGDWRQPTVSHLAPSLSALRGVRSCGVCPPTPVIPYGVPKEWVRERLNPAPPSLSALDLLIWLCTDMNVGAISHLRWRAILQYVAAHCVCVRGTDTKSGQIWNCARIRDAEARIAPRGGVEKRGARRSSVQVHICSARCFLAAFSTKQRGLEKFRESEVPKVKNWANLWVFSQ